MTRFVVHYEDGTKQRFVDDHPDRVREVASQSRYVRQHGRIKKIKAVRNEQHTS